MESKVTENDTRKKIEALKARMIIRVDDDFREYVLNTPKVSTIIVYSNRENCFSITVFKMAASWSERDEAKTKVFATAEEVEHLYKRLSGFVGLNTWMANEQKMNRINNVAKRHNSSQYIRTSRNV